MQRIGLSVWMLSLLLLVTGVSMAAPSLEDRVKRLERMMENPAMFQMSELLAQQQREIQTLQDRLDRLEYRYHKRFLKQQAQLDSLQKRLDRLYAHLKEKGLAPEELSDEADSLIPPEDENENEAGDTAGAGAGEAHDPGMQHDQDLHASQDAVAPVKPGMAGQDSDQAYQTGTGTGTGKDMDAPSSAKEAGNGENEHAPVSTQEAPISLHPPTEEEQALYEQGMLKLRQYRYEEAAQLLDRFVQQYPDSELAPQALYWAADAEWMVQERPEGAWQRFKQIIQRYPTTFLMPKVLYRGARALHQMQRDEEAKGLLKRLLENYPDTEEAARAESLLAQLSVPRMPLLQEEPNMKGVDITVQKESATHE